MVCLKNRAVSLLAGNYWSFTTPQNSGKFTVVSQYSFSLRSVEIISVNKFIHYVTRGASNYRPHRCRTKTVYDPLPRSLS